MQRDKSLLMTPCPEHPAAPAAPPVSQSSELAAVSLALEELMFAKKRFKNSGATYQRRVQDNAYGQKKQANTNEKRLDATGLGRLKDSTGQGIVQQQQKEGYLFLSSWFPCIDKGPLIVQWIDVHDEGFLLCHATGRASLSTKRPPNKPKEKKKGWKKKKERKCDTKGMYAVTGATASVTSIQEAESRVGPKEEN